METKVSHTVSEAWSRGQGRVARYLLFHPSGVEVRKWDGNGNGSLSADLCANTSFRDLAF